MKIGNRVQTMLGPGTINGFEHFTEDGMNSFYDDNYNETCRVRVELDDPSKWVFPKEQYGDPAFFQHGLTLL